MGQTLSSVKDLIDQARSLSADSGWRWLFRGQPLAKWDLQPRVHRDYGAEEERFLTQEFRARAGVRHTYRPRYKEYADWLALMQHYGLPTRLLDWTHSPLTAAFFAVQQTMRHFSPRDRQPQDAAIWALAPGLLNQAQGLEPYIYPLNSSDLNELVEGAFFERSADLVVAAAMAVESDVRMQVQRGAFTIHRTSAPLNDVAGNDPWLRKFTIPAGSVASLGEEVQALGVGLADLFPDLTSLANDLASAIPRKS